MAQDNQKFQKRIQSFQKDMSRALGNTIRKPMSARLGTVDSDGTTIVKVPDELADEPNEYYFSEIGSTSFRGKAQLKNNAILPNYLRYNTPIRVIRDVLTGRWEIIGVDSALFEQYYKDIEITEATLYGYNNQSYGLLRETTPQSMQAVVLPASYSIGDQWQYEPVPLFTLDWSQSPNDTYVPSTTGLQRWVLVQYNFETRLLEYTYGDEHDVLLTFNDAVSIDNTNNNNLLVPVPDDEIYFRIGYIRLFNGQTKITGAEEIVELQDYLAKGGGGGVDNIIVANDEVVTSGGQVLIEDDTNGHVALPFDELHRAKIQTGLSANLPATPDGVGDMYYAKDTQQIYVANSVGTSWGALTGQASISDLSDVDSTLTPTVNQTLVYSSETEQWEGGVTGFYPWYDHVDEGIGTADISPTAQDGTALGFEIETYLQQASAFGASDADDYSLSYDGGTIGTSATFEENYADGVASSISTGIPFASETLLYSSTIDNTNGIKGVGKARVRIIKRNTNTLVVIRSESYVPDSTGWKYKLRYNAQVNNGGNLTRVRILRDVSGGFWDNITARYKRWDIDRV